MSKELKEKAAKAAFELKAAADDFEGHVAARLDDLERPAQDVVNMSRDLYRLVGRIESAAKRMKRAHPQLAADVLHQLVEIDQRARRLSMDVDEALGLD